jgi:hypothetical protein
MAILVLALLPPVRAFGTKAALFCGRRPGLVAALSALAFAAGSRFVYHAHPLSMDEHAVLFQSRAFVEGRLSGQYPPWLLEWLVPEFFEGRFFKLAPASGEIAGVYWPGFSLLLVPFTALGVPWLLNPLIGGATVLTMHRLARKLLGSPEWAGYAVLLTIASPVIAINSISYYTMSAHLLASALYVLLLVQPTPPRAFAAGLVGSLALTLHNPVPHLLFAVPWIVWLCFNPRRVALLGALVAGYLPLCLVLGWGWAAFLQGVGGGAGNFGEIVASRLAAAFSWTSSTSGSSHLFDLAKLWIWAAPALVAAAALGAWQLRSVTGPWRALMASAALTYFGYFAVQFDQGHGWGFRYFHSAWLVLPLLAAFALRERPKGSPLPGYVAGCALLSLALLIPFRAFQVERYMTRHLSQLPAAESPESRVVLLDIRSGYYAWDLVQNDPFLHGRLTVLASRGTERDRLMMTERFPSYRLIQADRRGTVWGPRRD